MEEDRQKKALETETSAIPQDLESEPERPEESGAGIDQGPPAENSLANKRGRMIMAGLVAAVILSIIAVVVAGIFQLTARWMITCPTDLPVNDPAPILWKQLVSDAPVPQPLGVSPSTESATQFKRADAPGAKPEQDSVNKQ